MVPFSVLRKMPRGAPPTRTVLPTPESPTTRIFLYSLVELSSSTRMERVRPLAVAPASFFRRGAGFALGGKALPLFLGALAVIRVRILNPEHCIPVAFPLRPALFVQQTHAVELTHICAVL